MHVVWSYSILTSFTPQRGSVILVFFFHKHYLQLIINCRSYINLVVPLLGFSPGKGTMDAIFIVRQVQEKFLGKQKELWMAFVDSEKAFDRVPREVLWWALRYVGVEE